MDSTLDLESVSLTVNGLTLHGMRAGRRDRPLALLLHGFPEFWYGWRKQFEPLSRHFHVVAIDQRGYNLSDKPPRVRDYTADALAGDAIAVAHELGYERFHVVGHDWGGIVAWHIAARFPKRVDRLVVLNAPHPGATRKLVASDMGQVARFWYAALFQLPLLPEKLLPLHNFAALVRALHSSSRKGTFSEEDLLRYRVAWSQPGALRSMLNYYRAAFRSLHAPHDFRIHVPTLLLWGKKDAALKPRLAELSAERCDSCELVYFPEATHWLQHEEPDEVNSRIVEFLNAKS